MNSSLPSFLNSPAAGPGGAPASAANALTGVLASLEPLLATDPAQAASLGFAALMPATATPAPATSVVSVPAAAPLTAPASTASVVTVSAPTMIGARPLPRWSRGVLAPEGQAAPPSVDNAPAASPAVESFFATFASDVTPAGVAAPELPSPTDESTPAATTVSAETLQEAVAFAVTLLQSLLPEVTVPVTPTAAGQGMDGQPAGTGLSAMATTNRSLAAPLATPAEAFSPAPVSQPAPDDSAGKIDGQFADPKDNPGPGVATQDSTPMPAGAQPQTVASLEWPVALAADGAVEIKVELPPLKISNLAADLPGGTPIEISAELELPGQAVVRLEAAGVALPATASAQPENFAAQAPRAGLRPDQAESDSEIKFVFTGEKQVTPRSPSAGIAVAQDDGNMLAAPTEEPRAARKPQETSVLPVRAEFQAVQTPAERITVPASEPSGQSFASRAVETVTGLVDAQFSASMQKSGSVHLRMKFGGEDLSVRVAIRDGAVHTVFETDSPTLRSALSREWQAVAAQAPAQLMRYAEPVFSPAGGQNSLAGDASQQGARQQSQAQADAQQQQQSQSQRPAYAEGSSFARRSLVPETFVPEPAAPRVPALLPTSLRLSVLA